MTKDIVFACIKTEYIMFGSSSWRRQRTCVSLALLANQSRRSESIRLQRLCFYHPRYWIVVQVSRDKLAVLGTQIGKWTHSGKFRMTIGVLDLLAQYARYKVRPPSLVSDVTVTWSRVHSTEPNVKCGVMLSWHQSMQMPCQGLQPLDKFSNNQCIGKSIWWIRDFNQCRGCWQVSLHPLISISKHFPVRNVGFIVLFQTSFCYVPQTNTGCWCYGCNGSPCHISVVSIRWW